VGDVWIRTRASNGNVEVEIEDNGVGIPKEKLNRIFEPFFTTKPIGQGTGLGLSISYGIVEQHRGRIQVTSAPDKGSTFTVRLPIFQDKDAE
jgi:two-component system NtrC family sensor kinase